MSDETATPPAFKRRASLFISFVCAISLLAITGWLFNLPILASLRPDYIPMAPISGLIFLGLCGVWLMQRYFSARGGMRKLIQVGLGGMLIIVISLALRYFTGLGPDLEKLLYPNPPLFGQFSSARISPLTALGFFLAIAAFLLLSGSKPGIRKKSVAAGLALALFILCGLNIFGYLFGAPLFYGGVTIPMAITSAISFEFLSLGLMMEAGPDCWPVRMYVGTSLNARFMRAFIPASILIVLIQGLLNTAAAAWIPNPALRVAIAALVATSTVIIIISFIANNLSSDLERGRQAEVALHQSEAELRALFASMHDLVLVIDRAGVYRKIAPTNHDLLVKPPEVLLGQTLWEIFPPEQAEIFIGVMKKVLDTKQTAQVEYDLIIRDRTLSFETSISPMTESSTLWVVHDITKRKRVEQELFKLNIAVDDSSEAIFMTDREGLITFVNPGFTSLYGYAADEIVGKTTPRILKSGLMKHEDYAAFWQTLLNKQVKKGELINKTKDGRLLNIEGSVNPILDQQGAIIGFLGIQHDITERKHSELVQNAIFSITQAAITSVGMDALYHTIHTILGDLVPAENFYIAICEPLTGLISFPYYVDQNDQPPSAATHIRGITGYVIRTGRSLLANREVFDRLVEQGEVQVVGNPGVDWMGAPLKAEGRTIGVMAVQSYKQGIHYDQKDLNLLEIVSSQVAQAIERKRMEEEIVSLSVMDELTGLYNRRGFSLLAEREMKLARRFKRGVVLFFSDMDDLKTINDTQGHPQGDLALREMASILKGTFREADIVARFGGDEFVVLAVDVSMESVPILTDRLQNALKRRNLQDGCSYQLALSVGSAYYDPEAPSTLSELIAQADGRMYDQKQARKSKA